MQRLKIHAQIREEKGKSSNKALRRQGLVPVVSYKEGKPATSFKVSEKELNSVLHTKAGLNIVIDLVIDGKKTPKTVVVKDMQIHPLTEGIVHVDFHEISLQDTVKMNVPISLHGEAKQVAAKNGMVEHILWEVEIECKATSIPEKITLEISELDLGQSIHISDIPAMEGVTILTNPEDVVVTTKAAKVAEEEPVDEEESAEEPEVIAKGKKEEGASEEGSSGKEESPKE
jgi:large subunit ribosomal protein L25